MNNIVYFKSYCGECDEDFMEHIKLISCNICHKLYHEKCFENHQKYCTSTRCNYCGYEFDDIKKIFCEICSNLACEQCIFECPCCNIKFCDNCAINNYIKHENDLNIYECPKCSVRFNSIK